MMSRRTMRFRQKTGNGVRGLRGAALLIAALGAGLFLAGFWNAACASVDKTGDLPLLERWKGVKFLKAGSQRIPLAAAGSAAGPLNTTYEIGAESVALVDGRAEAATAPGSASRMETRVFGQPVFGDLDGDGDKDSALLLLQDFEASGTFYYVAVARKLSDTYAGTNAVLLGDRIAPQNVAIANGVVVANYAIRGPQEPMTARPSLHLSKYLTLEKEALVAIEPVGKGEQVLKGWVTIGHEMRSFRPCSDVRALWISGESPALKEIQAALREAYPDSHQDNRLFMVLAGRHAPRPTQGFGAEYESAFYATYLVKVWPKGTCTPDR